MSIHTAMIEDNLDQREGQPEPNSVGETGGGAVLDVTPCSAFWVLFEHMSKNHGLTLLDSELSDICHAVDEMRAAWEADKLKRRCRTCWGNGQVEIQSGPYYRTCDACGGSGLNATTEPRHE